MKVQIWYGIDGYAEKFKRDKYEAFLCFKQKQGKKLETEVIVARGSSFAEAKRRAIAMFKLLPSSEEIDL